MFKGRDGKGGKKAKEILEKNLILICKNGTEESWLNLTWQDKWSLIYKKKF